MSRMVWRSGSRRRAGWCWRGRAGCWRGEREEGKGWGGGPSKMWEPRGSGLASSRSVSQ